MRSSASCKLNMTHLQPRLTLRYCQTDTTKTPPPGDVSLFTCWWIWLPSHVLPTGSAITTLRTQQASTFFKTLFQFILGFTKSNRKYSKALPLAMILLSFRYSAGWVLKPQWRHWRHMKLDDLTLRPNTPNAPKWGKILAMEILT